MRRPFVVAGNVSSVQGIDNHKLGHTRSHGTAADQGFTRSDAEHGIGHGGGDFGRLIGGDAFGFCLLVSLGTLLGAATVFFLKGAMNQRLQKLLLGFAAGVMIAASIWSLLIPAIDAAEAGGDIGWIPLEDDSHLVMKALKTVAQGEMLGPIQDGELAYLFLVTQRREQRALTWEQAKSFAATRAEEYCRTQSHTQVRDTLFEKYGVQIDREAIRALFTRP